MTVLLSLVPAALITATENSWSLNGSRSLIVVELDGGRMIGFMLGGLPRSGVTKISMLVMGVRPSPPVIQDRDTLVSIKAVTMRLFTGSAGTVSVCVCVCVVSEQMDVVLNRLEFDTTYIQV